MLKNPFKPTAGMLPPILVGREHVMEDYEEGLESGPGAPGRLMRIAGPRGSGKTVLLTELGALAKNHDWMVVDVSGEEDLPSVIQRRLQTESPLSSISVKASLPFVSAEADLGGRDKDETFRETFERVVRGLSKKGKGLLITIDEVQDAEFEDMRVVASNVQFMIREGRNISLVFAGLTTGVMNLLNGDALTFLRRAMSEELGSIPLDEVESSYRSTFEDSGLRAEDGALRSMAQATHGFAYLIQLVGYYTWRRSRKRSEGAAVDEQMAAEGIRDAITAFGDSVLEPALSGLTKPAVHYLFAMTEDKSASSTAEVARRMGKGTAYANTYRRILIERQVIEATAPGYVGFSIPFMRDYLIDHRDAILSRYGG